MAARKTQRPLNGGSLNGFGWETPYDIYLPLYEALPKTGVLTFWQEQAANSPLPPVYAFRYTFVPKPPAPQKPFTIEEKISHADLTSLPALYLARRFLVKGREALKQHGVELP